MISRRALARALGLKTSSLARADRRGVGPGAPIFLSKTFALYREENVAAYLRVKGLEWSGRDVRPIEGPSAVPDEQSSSMAEKAAS